jgi:hypothetical protein
MANKARVLEPREHLGLRLGVSPERKITRRAPPSCGSERSWSMDRTAANCEGRQSITAIAAFCGVRR